MQNRYIARTLRVLRAAVAIFVVAGVAGALRLSQGPVDVSYFTGRIEAALSAVIPNAQTDVGRLLLSVEDGRLALSAMDVAATGALDGARLGASRIDVNLSFADLLRGEVRAEALHIVGARLTAIRGDDGAISLRAAGRAAEDNSAGAFDVLALTHAWMAGRGMDRELPDIQFRDATLVVLDGAAGAEVWRGYANAGARFAPTEASLWAEIASNGGAAATPVRITATLAQGVGGEALLTLASADLAALADLARLFGAVLPQLSGDLDGDIRLSVDADLQPTSADAMFEGQSIALRLPDGAEYAVDRIAAEAQYDADRRKLTLSGVRIGGDQGLVGAATLTRLDGDRAFDISGRLDHVDLEFVARLLGDVDIARGLVIVGSVDFDVSIDAGRLTGAEARVATTGRIARDDIFYAPLGIEHATGFFAYDAAAGALVAKGLDAIVGGVHVAGEATVGLDATGAIDTLKARGVVGAIDVKDLPTVWPRAVSPGGRAWFQRNVGQGRVAGGAFKLDKQPGEEIVASGEFEADGLEVRYWDPMPVASRVAGKGVFAGNRLDIRVTSAVSGGVTSDDVKLSFTELGAKTEFIEIDGALHGDAADLLAVLDRKPLGYAAWLGVDPAATRGAIDGRLKLRFPLVDKLSVDDLAVSAKGTARGAFLPKVVRGWDLTADRLKLDINLKALKLEGAGALLDRPIEFAGALQFGPGEERARFTGAWSLTREIRRALGLSGEQMRRRLTGDTPATFDISFRENNVYRIAVDADLTSATVLAQDIGWLKPKGAPARFAATAYFQGDRPLRIDGLRLAADDLTLSGAVAFDPATGGLQRVDIKRLVGAGHDLAADYNVGDATDSLRISGRRADLRPLLKPAAKATGEPAPTESASRPLAITFDLAEARLGENIRLQDVKADLTFADDRPFGIAAKAAYPGGALSIASAEPTDPGSDITISATDFGRLLAALALTDGARGGVLTLVASPRPTDGYDLRGDATTFQFQKKVFAEIAGDAAVNLISLVDAGENVRFDKVEFRGGYADGVIAIARGRAAGAALGLTTAGSIDLGRRRLDLKGALAPAYGVSRALGSIPVVGAILTGSKKEGVFAATYKASGDLDNPSFAVNRLSALAPGILRDIFGAKPTGATQGFGDTPANSD